MNSFLACAGMNGDETNLKKLVELAKTRNPDAILFAGGIVKADSDATSKRESVRQFFEILGKSTCLSLVIPGAQDAPLGEFMRSAINAEVTYSNVVSVHAAPYTKSNTFIIGLGGQATESEDATGPVIEYSHTSAEYWLRSLWHTAITMKVLLFSEPPAGKLSGNGGSALVDEFIKAYHPSICVVGGRKEHRGYEKEKHGLLVNPGWLSEGSAAWINWTDRIVQTIDL
jgi:Icc-related predicted phosphoesterase